MAKKKVETKEDNVLFTFNGAKFYKNTVYKVNHKLDLDAPKSWRDKGYSKAPRTGDTASCPYNRPGNRYDTGFEPYSPRYLRIEEAVKANLVSVLKTNIVEPYLMVTGKKEEELSSYNLNFWDSYMVSFDEDKNFNTNDPVDAMALYIAITSGRLVPRATQEVDLEGDPFFNRAAYMVYSDKEKAQIRNVVTNNKYKAIKAFSELLETDMKMVKRVMMYIGLPVTNIETQDGLMRVFNANVENETEKVSIFNTAINKLATDVGKMEITLYYELKAQSRTDKIRMVNNKVFYDGVQLEGNLMTSAKMLAENSDDELVKVKNELLGLK